MENCKHTRVTINNATDATVEEIRSQVHDMFVYHPWDEEQIRRGNEVRSALESAVRAIIHNVPPGPDRSVAIRKIREARMDANSAITHDGKY